MYVGLTKKAAAESLALGLRRSFLSKPPLLSKLAGRASQAIRAADEAFEQVMRGRPKPPNPAIRTISLKEAIRLANERGPPLLRAVDIPKEIHPVNPLWIGAGLGLGGAGLIGAGVLGGKALLKRRAARRATEEAARVAAKRPWNKLRELVS